MGFSSIHSEAMKLRGSLNPGEYTLTATRAHGIVLARPLACALVAMAAWSFSSALGGAWGWLSYGALAVALVLLLCAVRGFLPWAFTCYFVTSDRLVIRRGLFSRRDISIPLYEIEGVNVGPKALLGIVAAAPLTVHGRGYRHVLQAVPDPERFSARIRTAQQQYMGG